MQWVRKISVNSPDSRRLRHSVQTSAAFLRQASYSQCVFAVFTESIQGQTGDLLARETVGRQEQHGFLIHFIPSRILQATRKGKSDLMPSCCIFLLDLHVTKEGRDALILLIIE